MTFRSERPTVLWGSFAKEVDETCAFLHDVPFAFDGVYFTPQTVEVHGLPSWSTCAIYYEGQLMLSAISTTYSAAAPIELFPLPAVPIKIERPDFYLTLSGNIQAPTMLRVTVALRGVGTHRRLPPVNTF